MRRGRSGPLSSGCPLSRHAAGTGEFLCFREMLLQYRSQALSIALERRIVAFPRLFLKYRNGFLVVLDHVFDKLLIELGAAEAFELLL